MPRKKATPEVQFATFKTSWGWCAAAATSRGICRFVLPVANEADARQEILNDLPDAVSSPQVFKSLFESVDRYFDGWTTKFGEFEIDLSDGTPFQQRVWKVIHKVPYGAVRSYRWIGLEIGRPEAARAIGAATGANPIPLIIPCHRIVSESGDLCGFSALGGISLKERMLEMEGVSIVKSDHRTSRVSAKPTTRHSGKLSKNP